MSSLENTYIFPEIWTAQGRSPRGDAELYARSMIRVQDDDGIWYLQEVTFSWDCALKKPVQKEWVDLMKHMTQECYKLLHLIKVDPSFRNQFGLKIWIEDPDQRSEEERLTALEKEKL